MWSADNIFSLDALVMLSDEKLDQQALVGRNRGCDMDSKCRSALEAESKWKWRRV